MPRREVSVVLLVLALAFTDAVTSCANQTNAAACKANGCSFCSWCPGCAGQCYGDEGEAFTCSAVLSTYPDTAEYGYDCDPFDTNPGMCVKMPMGPSAPTFDNFSSCINQCQPAKLNHTDGLFVCEPSTAQCVPAPEGQRSEGTSKALCKAQCNAHYLCNADECQSQGVDGPGNLDCDSSQCPAAPTPGPKCAEIVECGDCLSHQRCGWCPGGAVYPPVIALNSTAKCVDLAANAPIFYCPPGFTTDHVKCPK